MKKLLLIGFLLAMAAGAGSVLGFGNTKHCESDYFPQCAHKLNSDGCPSGRFCSVPNSNPTCPSVAGKCSVRDEGPCSNDEGSYGDWKWCEY